MSETAKYLVYSCTLIWFVCSCKSTSKRDALIVSEMSQITFITLDSISFESHTEDTFSYFFSTNIPDQTIISWHLDQGMDITDINEFSSVSDTLKIIDQQFVVKNVQHTFPAFIFAYVEAIHNNDINFVFANEQATKSNFAYCECSFATCYSVVRQSVKNKLRFIKQY